MKLKTPRPGMCSGRSTPRDDLIENDDGQRGGPDREKPRAAALAREVGLLLDGQHT